MSDEPCTDEAMVADGWDVLLTCPECDDGFADHPGCSECRNTFQMGHAVTCSKFKVEKKS